MENQTGIIYCLKLNVIGKVDSFLNGGRKKGMSERQGTSQDWRSAGMIRLEVHNNIHQLDQTVFEYLVKMQVGEIFNPFNPFTMKHFILPILEQIIENHGLK